MDIRTFQVFLALEQTLHFGKTARQMNLSPSAVSRHLQRLEQQIGQRLIERDNRSVKLTPAGRRFLEYARKAIDDWQQIRSDLDTNGKSLHGELSVFASVTASHSVLSTILPEMRNAYPGIDIKLRTGDQADAMDRIISGEDDAAIIAVPDMLPRKLACLPLLSTPLKLVGPTMPGTLSRTIDAALAEQIELDWSALPVVLAERGLARTRFLDRMNEMHCEPSIYAQVAGHEAVVSMVSLGFGVALVPELVIEHSPVRNTIRVLPYLKDLEPFKLGLCAMKDRLSDPMLNAMWQCAEHCYPQQ